MAVALVVDTEPFEIHRWTMAARICSVYGIAYTSKYIKFRYDYFTREHSESEWSYGGLVVTNVVVFITFAFDIPNTHTHTYINIFFLHFQLLCCCFCLFYRACEYGE